MMTQEMRRDGCCLAPTLASSAAHSKKRKQTVVMAGLKIGYSEKDLLEEKGRFGIVFKGKLNGKLDVAVKRVEKKLTKVEDSDFFYNVNGHPNILNFFCTISADLKYL